MKSKSKFEEDELASESEELIQPIKEHFSDIEGAYDLHHNLLTDDVLGWKLQSEHIDKKLEEKLFLKTISYLQKCYELNFYELLFKNQETAQKKQILLENQNNSLDHLTNYQRKIREDIINAMKTLKILARNSDNKNLARKNENTPQNEVDAITLVVYVCECVQALEFDMNADFLVVLTEIICNLGLIHSLLSIITLLLSLK